MHEVIIVGGGPIGSMTGFLLAKKGIDVAIIEKQKHPRWKPCGEGISKEGVEILKRHDLYSPVQNLLRNINGISFNILDMNLAFQRYTTPVAFTFDRTKFDYALFTYAKDAGAEVHESEQVQQITTQGKIQVKTQRNIFQSKILVGADGVNSIVGKKLFRPWAKNELGLGKVARYKIAHPPKTITSNVMEYYLAEGGYGWIFPRMEDEGLILNIGIATNNSSKLHQVFDWFISTIESTKDLTLKGQEIDGKIWKHLLPGNGPCRGTCTHSTLLIGDAGGFVNPLTGGGLKYGTLSAIYAAETITKFFNNEIESLQPYQDVWQKDIQPIFHEAYQLREKLYFTHPLRLLSEIQNHPEMKKQLFQSFVGEKGVVTE